MSVSVDDTMFALLVQLYTVPAAPSDGVTPLLVSPGDSVVHFHKCPVPTCGIIWSHAKADFDSTKAYVDGHHCPVCDTEEYWKCDAEGNPV